ncbi:MAG: hypothetical protein QOD38_1597 [Acidimicrobiaceae bacterium]
MKRLVFALVALLSLTGVLVTAADAQTRPAPGPHVWVIVLENKSYEETFGDSSPATYLNGTLVPAGALLRQYYGTGHLSLDNYISMISGQAPNPQTQGDCVYYNDFVSPNGGALDGDGQALGNGCVYPTTVLTLADQLKAARVPWRGYLEDMGSSCRHPALNGADGTQHARVGDQYAARHNPFVYFHSIVDDDAYCQSRVVNLSQMSTDMAAVATTPRFSFITPNLCNDGHDAPCVDGQPGGLVSADAFLQTWVPQITASPAYKKDGVLIVMFDESEAAGSQSDTRFCCHEPTGPNTPMPGITGRGGGRMGAVVLSSRFVHPGTVTDEPYNHYSLLRTLEDLYGVTHLGYAAQSGLQSFGRDIFPMGKPRGR